VRSIITDVDHNGLLLLVTMGTSLLSLLALAASLTLAEAKALWASTPATHGDQSSESYILKTGYPVGNGKLGGEESEMDAFRARVTY
jgi:hypothetical protein